MELVDHVAEVMERYRAGAIEVQEADRAIHQYHRAAGELFKFCFGAGAQPEFVADLISGHAHAVDWWARGVPRSKRGSR